LLALGAIATASTEFARETVRKPYVIGGHMYSNGVRISDVPKFNQDGYLTSSLWTVGTDRMSRGEAMFRGQCMSCHTRTGYRSMSRLLQGRDEKGIVKLLELLHKPTTDSAYVKYMPPLVGTPEEIDALAGYLTTLSKPTEPATTTDKVAKR